MSEQKNKSDFKAKNTAEVTAATRSACSGDSRLSRNDFNLQLNLERDKTGDVGKFHDLTTNYAMARAFSRSRSIKTQDISSITSRS